LGYSVKHKGLLELALTHKSFSNDSINCYERLEFLGDAVLELIVSKYIFEHFKESEGRLTHIRSAVVCKETLSQLGKKVKEVEVETVDGKKARCKVASMESSKGTIIEVPDKVQHALGITRGDLVKVKPCK